MKKHKKTASYKAITAFFLALAIVFIVQFNGVFAYTFYEWKQLDNFNDNIINTTIFNLFGSQADGGRAWAEANGNISSSARASANTYVVGFQLKNYTNWNITKVNISLQWYIGVGAASQSFYIGFANYSTASTSSQMIWQSDYYQEINNEGSGGITSLLWDANSTSIGIVKGGALVKTIRHNSTGALPTIIVHSGSGMTAIMEIYNVSYYVGRSVDILENSQSFNSTTFEQLTEGYSINLNYTSSDYSSIYASLWYNGTTYPATKVGTGDNIIFTRSLSLTSANIGTNTFKWIFNYTNSTGTFWFNSTASAQTVNPILFDACNSTLSVPFINFTFKDEATSAFMNATIPSSTFQYWLGDGTVKKTLSYSNTSVSNRNYAFCSSVGNRILNTDISLQYAFTSYPQRSYTQSLALTNNTTNKTLYLLSSADGLYVTFQVINAADQPLEGVASNVSRTILSENVVLGAGSTGSSGGITFWLNPEFPHTVCFLLAPYPQYCTTETFTQTDYTITLGSAGTSNATDYFKGISYSINPTGYLSNGTNYSFNFTILSTYYALESWGFNITNQNGTLMAEQVSSISGGSTLNSTVNTGQNTTFTMNYYWVINGTMVQSSRSWIILDLSDSSFSISHAVSDLKSYIASGFWGLDNFGLGIIVFAIILITTGTLRVKYGINDEAVLVGVIFSLVALFDVGFELIPNPINAVAHFPTILMGLIFMGFIYKEVFQ